MACLGLAFAAGICGAPNLQAATVSEHETVHALSGASFVTPEKPVRIVIVKFVRPAPNEEIVPASVEALKRHFNNNVTVQHLSLKDLHEAIKNAQVDVFLSSSGFYRRLADEGVRSLVTAVSEDYRDPNHGDAAAFVTAADRNDLNVLADLQGKRLWTSTPTAFTGLLVPYGEMMSQGFRVKDFFSDTQYLGDGNRMEFAPQLLLERKADVAFLRLCFIEKWMERHPDQKGRFKVINRKDRPGEACVRSTDLYPTWTVASTRQTDPRISRAVTQALLNLQPVGDDQIYWGVATDYSAVDKLFRDTKTGPYAYLNEWTVRRFVETYWPWLMLAGVLIIGLMLHSVRVTQLVRRRTAALSNALTEQKALEKQAQSASQRIDRLERAGVVSQLSVIFAHEMRQPLGAISLYSFGLRRLLKNGTVDQNKFVDVLNKLDVQTERANDIVTRVRGYAKSQKPKRVLVELKHELERAVEELKVTGRWRSQIKLSVLWEPVVMADPVEMELVALNLIKNALDASDSGGRTGTVIVTLGEEDDRAIFTVSDDGPGNLETAKRLKNDLDSTKVEGLGLGLSIVRGILEAYGGRLTFMARRTTGLTARVSLPVAQMPHPGDEPSTDTDVGTTPCQDDK